MIEVQSDFPTPFGPAQGRRPVWLRRIGSRANAQRAKTRRNVLELERNLVATVGLGAATLAGGVIWSSGHAAVGPMSGVYGLLTGLTLALVSTATTKHVYNPQISDCDAVIADAPPPMRPETVASSPTWRRIGTVYDAFLAPRA